MADLLGPGNDDNTSHQSWRVGIVTYNVNRRLPPIDENQLDKFMCSLLANVCWDSENDRPNAQIIAIGLQEVPWNVFVCTWHNAFRTFLSSYGYSQIGLCYTAGGSISLLVFMPRNLLACINRTETKTVWLGAWGMSSHKGAVGMQIRLVDSTNITFVTAHKSPGDKNLGTRVKEYSRIINEMRFSDCPSQGIIADDYVFLFGDFNYRVDSIHANNQELIAVLNQDNHKTTADLRQRDQMTVVRGLKEAFAEFEEPPINFKPTYRFLVGTKLYDPLRVPSWTDRIVYRVDEIAGVPKDRSFGNLECECQAYSMDVSANISDHKPVVAAFFVKLSPNALKPNWRVRFLLETNSVWICGQPNTSMYVSNDTNIPWGFRDWIGVFPEKLESDCESSVTWHSILASWEDSAFDPIQRTNVKAQYLNFQAFKLPQARGKFRLGFYSRTYSCLIGLSEPFEIIDPTLDSSVDATDYAFDDDATLSQLQKEIAKTNIEDPEECEDED